eukprot:5193698-Alexandrium_andersonii.AAC.1
MPHLAADTAAGAPASAAPSPRVGDSGAAAEPAPSAASLGHVGSSAGGLGRFNDTPSSAHGDSNVA